MPFKKGASGNPQGREPGKPNKSTANAREAIAKFVDGNSDRMQGWLEQIAKDDPKGAFDRLMAVMEYHVPKLARTEVTGKDGADLMPKVLVLKNSE